jgi:hypothetical protein
LSASASIPRLPIYTGPNPPIAGRVCQKRTARTRYYTSEADGMSLKLAIKSDNYDSVLQPARPGMPAKLTLRLQIYLIPTDPSAFNAEQTGKHFHLAENIAQVRRGVVKDTNEVPFLCRSWLKRDFNAFKISFKRMVELSWNNQIILLPPEDSPDQGGLSDHDYLQFVTSPQDPAHVECALDIEMLPELDISQHPNAAVMDVVCLDNPGHSRFRSNSGLISNQAVELKGAYDSRWSSVRTYHAPAAHEVGHWLGGHGSRDGENRIFQHIDLQYCSTLPGHTPNNPCEYGHVLSKHRAMMGAGNLATDYEATPWLTRIRRHTYNLSPWKSIHRIHFNAGKAEVSNRQKQLTPALTTK